jgi:hypothetical protein
VGLFFAVRSTAWCATGFSFGPVSSSESRSDLLLALDALGGATAMNSAKYDTHTLAEPTLKLSSSQHREIVHRFTLLKEGVFGGALLAHTLGDSSFL